MTCSIASVLGALGDRWGMLIVRDLLLGLSRYDELQRSTGVTNATLSDRLKLLEENELIERRRYQTKPDRYEYVLTARGKDIALVMQALAQVGDKWNLAKLPGPPLRFINARSGKALKLALAEAASGDLVRAADVRVEPGPGADDLMRWRLETARTATARSSQRPDGRSRR